MRRVRLRINHNDFGVGEIYLKKSLTGFVGGVIRLTSAQRWISPQKQGMFVDREKTQSTAAGIKTGPAPGPADDLQSRATGSRRILERSPKDVRNQCLPLPAPMSPRAEPAFHRPPKRRSAATKRHHKHKTGGSRDGGEPPPCPSLFCILRSLRAPQHSPKARQVKGFRAATAKPGRPSSILDLPSSLLRPCLLRATDCGDSHPAYLA